jgi:hypothetical protein
VYRRIWRAPFRLAHQHENRIADVIRSIGVIDSWLRRPLCHVTTVPLSRLPHESYVARDAKGPYWQLGRGHLSTSVLPEMWVPRGSVTAAQQTLMTVGSGSLLLVGGRRLNEPVKFDVTAGYERTIGQVPARSVHWINGSACLKAAIPTAVVSALE